MVKDNTKSGILLVISSPSGAGKTTLARMLADLHDLNFSVSYTTRPRRQGEQDGRDYHFVSQEIFEKMVDEKRFAEWAHVHGHRYGTCVDIVDEALSEGRNFIFDIDYQGAKQIRQQWPAESVLCFILPPSLAELERRLRSRGTDAPAIIDKRLAMAKEELRQFGDYDYLIENADPELATKQLSAIFVAANLTMEKMNGLAKMLLQDMS